MSETADGPQHQGGNPLRRAWENIRNEPGFLSNVLVVLGLLVLAAVVGGYIFSQARANWPWEDINHYSATFDQAPALSPGNGQEVRIAGVKVGEIRDAEVDDRGRAVLDLAIEPQYPVFANARLVLRPKSPLNEMYIELSPGGPPAPKLENGGALSAANAQRPIQVDEVFGDLDGNARSALTTLLAESDTALAKSPQTLPVGLRATDGLVQRLRPLAGGLQSRDRLIGRLITSLGTIADTVGKNDKRLTELANSLQSTLRATGRQSPKLDAALSELPELTARLRDATGGVDELSGQLDPTLDNLKKASEVLPGAVARTTDTVDQLGVFVDKAKPVLSNARPVIADLRPFIGDLKQALPDLEKSTRRLDYLTSYSLPYLTDLQAFTHNTNSIYSLKTNEGVGILRAQQVYSPETVAGLAGLPAGLFQPPGALRGAAPGAAPRLPVPPVAPAAPVPGIGALMGGGR